VTLIGAAPCKMCGGGPTVNVTLRSAVVILIAFQVATQRGFFCRDCGLATYREMTKYTLVAGWWGLPALVGLIAVLMNVSAAAKVKELPAPSGSIRRRPVPGTPVSRSPALIVPILLAGLILILCCAVPRL
jgi:hypothetical protein